MIPAKVFSAQIFCSCRLKCHEKIDVVVPKAAYDQYYNLENWSRKTQFLRSLIQRRPVKKNNDPKINFKPRNFVSKYFLEDDQENKKQVCSMFLTKILQISRVTLFRAARSTESNPQVLERRGLYPTRRTDARKIEFKRTFIRQFPQFPTFESHHDFKYLHPRLSIKKMYKMYVEKCNLSDTMPTKLPIFRRTFKRYFNLRFVKRSQKCTMCKRFDDVENSLIVTKKMRKKVKKERKSHDKKVRNVKNK